MLTVLSAELALGVKPVEPFHDSSQFNQCELLVIFAVLLPNRLVVILHEAVGIAKRVSNEQVIAGLLLLQLLQVFEQLTNALVLNNIVA